jgi:hypothetical protein
VSARFCCGIPRTVKEGIALDISEFDRFADEYGQMHEKNIAITGEKPEFFHEYKIRVLRQMAQASLILEAFWISGRASGTPLPISAAISLPLNWLARMFHSAASISRNRGFQAWQRA